jgi:hypothetical protein
MASPAHTQHCLHNPPANVNGSTSQLTQGIANALAAMPTQEIWPNHQALNGAKAKLNWNCRLSTSSTLEYQQASLPLGKIKSTPTATKLSQKPACKAAQGSHVKTKQATHNHTAPLGQSAASNLNDIAQINMQSAR